MSVRISSPSATLCLPTHPAPLGSKASARRRLFADTSPADVNVCLQRELLQNQLESEAIWNYCFIEDRPSEGRLRWQGLGMSEVPVPYHPHQLPVKRPQPITSRSRLRDVVLLPSCTSVLPACARYLGRTALDCPDVPDTVSQACLTSQLPTAWRDLQVPSSATSEFSCTAPRSETPCESLPVVVTSRDASLSTRAEIQLTSSVRAEEEELKPAALQELLQQTPVCGERASCDVAPARADVEDEMSPDEALASLDEALASTDKKSKKRGSDIVDYFKVKKQRL